MSDNVIPVIRVCRKRTLPSIPGIILTVKKSKGSDGNAIGSSFTESPENTDLSVGNNYSDNFVQKNSYFKLCKSTDVAEIDKAGIIEVPDAEVALIDYNAKKSNIEILGNPNLTPTELLNQFAALKTEEKKGVTVINDKDNEDIVYDYYVMSGKTAEEKFSKTDIDECNLREATYDEIQFYYGGDSDSDADKKLNGFDESDDSNDEDNWRNEYPDDESSDLQGDDDDSFDEYGNVDNTEYYEYVNDHSNSESDHWNE
ncbi:Transcription factor Iwr1 family-containing protein [Strongyloides ratti]|uniref:Probable RNA polymerase II nuclear localization protein SLC7A6OS n=1 Tax=Strongyloides ratti TaxID=34506 RepID=A0A090MW10_STRRB|nr:Transcription factor Iwr1 family-containing protein [Strongyloides ratti]CEF63293.1 Transcription factor Iwr1 family-containing protein [Strongyloides ratti]